MAEGIITRRGGGEIFEPIQATGGTETTITEAGVDYKVHTFTSSGTFEVTDAGTSSVGTSPTVEYLVVAGGGGGGSSGGTNRGGAGGAGGLLNGTGVSVPAQSYAITVGAGGSGGAEGGARSTNGTDSVFNGLTAIGGGAGSSFTSSWQPALDGGSGGGCSGGNSTAGQGIAGQGNDGAGNTNGGGGGGAGAAGSAQTGGAGLSVFGITYAKGGDGDANTAGATNSGNGADGRPFNVTTALNGGSGIVIIRYRIA